MLVSVQANTLPWQSWRLLYHSSYQSLASRCHQHTIIPPGLGWLCNLATVFAFILEESPDISSFEQILWGKLRPFFTTFCQINCIEAMHSASIIWIQQVVVDLGCCSLTFSIRSFKQHILRLYIYKCTLLKLLSMPYHSSVWQFVLESNSLQS